MQKKLLLIPLVVILCFVLTGCGNNTENDNDSYDETSVNTSSSEDNNDSSSNEDIKLYSDNTKYVFELGNIRYVFYYTGDTITAYHTYIDYGDHNTASATNTVLSAEDLEGVDKHYVKGKYIVFEYNKSEYEDMTVSELKTAYAYMKEVTK